MRKTRSARERAEGSMEWQEAEAGYAYRSLHSHEFSMVLGKWEIQVLLSGIFWISFYRIFSIHDF